AARPLPPRIAGPHRHARRMRHQPVRRVYRAARRPRGEVVLAVRGAGRRPFRDHDRGAREGRKAAPDAAGLLGRAWPAVRVLHAGDDHLRLRDHPAQREPGRGADPRRITGKGTYVDDVKLPGTTFAAFVRSPHAHARIGGIDTAAAKRVKGVVAVYTGKDLVAGGMKPIPVGWLIPGIKIPARHPL